MAGSAVLSTPFCGTYSATVSGALAADGLGAAFALGPDGGRGVVLRAAGAWAAFDGAAFGLADALRAGSVPSSTFLPSSDMLVVKGSGRPLISRFQYTQRKATFDQWLTRVSLSRLIGPTTGTGNVPVYGWVS